MNCIVLKVYITIFISLIVNFHSEGVSGQLVSNVKKAPKDYAYSPNGSRVQDLAHYFESMNKRNSEPGEDTEGQNVIITLSEAASKLRFLSFGYPLDTKCNKYVKLFNQPNIRSFATINLLVREDKSFSDIQQTDANLFSKLLNERNFDALSKLQTILQVLESERSESRSVFELDVQKDLLDCMNYYIYRHQKATSGMIEYIRECREQILPLIVDPLETESGLRKLSEQVNTIKHIESLGDIMINDRNSTSIWLAELSRLKTLMSGNTDNLPAFVIDFVTDPMRLKRLKLIEPKIEIAPETTQAAFNLEFNSEKDYLTKESKFLSSLEVDEPEPETEANDAPMLNVDETQDVKLKKDELVADTSIGEQFESKMDTSQSNVQVNSGQSGDENDSLTFIQKEEKDKSSLDSIQPARSTTIDVNLKPNFSELLSDTNESSLDEVSNNQCEKYLSEFNDYLRLQNWKYLELSRADLIAHRLHKFKADCMNNQSSNEWEPGIGSTKSSIWPFISMTRKLSTWSLNSLKDISETQQTLVSILELVH